MGEWSAAHYKTAHYLWFGKLLGEYRIMLSVFVCLWSQVMTGYLEPLLWSIYILQLEIIFVLNVQMSGCTVFPFSLTEKMFLSGCFRISRHNQVG